MILSQIESLGEILNSRQILLPSSYLVYSETMGFV